MASGIFGEVLESYEEQLLRVEDIGEVPSIVISNGVSTSSLSPQTPLSKLSKNSMASSLNLKQKSKLNSMDTEQNTFIDNPSTNGYSAVRKASYFDKLTQSIEGGLDEKAAKSLAWKSISNIVPLDSQEQQKTGLLMPSAEYVDIEKSYLSQKIAKKLAEKRGDQKLTGDIIHKEVMAANAMKIITSADLAQSDLESVKKMVQKLNRLSADLENPLADGIPKFNDEPEEFRKIKQQHYCISLLLGEFESISDALMYGREREVAIAHEKHKRDLMEKQYQRLTSEYEKKINHDNCNLQINNLSTELAAIKKDSAATVNLNIKLTTELQEFKLKASLLEGENKVVIEELAKKSMQLKRLKTKIKSMKARIAEKSSDEDQVLEKRPVSRISKVSSNPTENATSSLKSGIRRNRPNSEYSAVSFMDLGDDISDESSIHENSIQISKPVWNKSTATKILSQKPPPSVIWASDHDATADSEQESESNTSRKRSTYFTEMLTRQKNKNRILANKLSHYMNNRMEVKAALEELSKLPILNEKLSAVLKLATETISEKNEDGMISEQDSRPTSARRSRPTSAHKHDPGISEREASVKPINFARPAPKLDLSLFPKAKPKGDSRSRQTTFKPSKINDINQWVEAIRKKRPKSAPIVRKPALKPTLPQVLVASSLRPASAPIKK